MFLVDCMVWSVGVRVTALDVGCCVLSGLTT